MALTKITLSGAIDTIRGMSNKFNNLIDDLLSTSNGLGASQVGIEDTAGNMSATNVEDALAEVYTDTSSTRTLAEIFSEAPATTTGLTWGYTGGLFRVDNSVTEVSAGTVSLTDDATNYVEIKTSDGSVTRNTTAFTSGRIPLRQIVTASGVQTTSTDKRAWFTQDAADTGATTVVAGIIEIATDAEVLAGTATDLAVVPSSLKSIRDIIPIQNLLTNSGFGPWSNSTLEDVRNLPDATTTVAGTTCTSTAHALTKGMLVTDDTDACFEAVSITNVNVFEVDRAGASSGTQWQEVTPGCVAADILGPDGWTKVDGCELHRVHSDGATEAVTKQGSFYALKISNSTGNVNMECWWPSNTSTKAEHLAKFAGRTVAFGCWVKTDAASQVKLNLRDSADNHFSDLNTGAGWEWLEVSTTIGDIGTATQLKVGVYVTATKTAYFSQPMLVFGSSIGEGNYQPIPQEVIWFDNANGIQMRTAATSSAGSETVNVEARSDGKIPKGVKAIQFAFEGANSAAGKYTIIYGDVGNLGLVIYSQVAAKAIIGTNVVKLATDGTMIYNFQDTNWSGLSIVAQAVELS